LARDFGGFSGVAGVGYREINSCAANFFQHRGSEFPGFAATRCGIHDGEKFCDHWGEGSGAAMAT
jgi:hypothetical protein